MTLAPRLALSSLPDYELRDLTDRGVRLRVHRNEASLPPPPHVIDAVRNLSADAFRYYPVDLQHSVVKRLARRLNVPSRCLVIGSGADDILMAVARVAIEPGDNVVTVRPTFGMYARAGLVAGARVREIAYGQRWSLDAGALLRSADERTKLVYLGHPNNPTGELLAPETLDAIARAMPQALVVVDEIYVSFREASLLRYTARLPNAVVVGSFSKAAALAGLRVGFAVTDPSIARALRRVMTPFPLSVTSLAAADAYLRGIAATTHFERSLDAQVRRSLDAIVDVVAPFARNIWRGLANFMLVDFAFDTPSFSKAMRRLGIAVRTFSDPDLAGCVRFCALDDRSTNELVSALRDVLPQFSKENAVNA